MSSPFTPVEGGVRVRIRVTPRASRDAIGDIVGDGTGGVALKVAVTAVPEGGKANRAVIRLLARAWRVPKTTIEVVAGMGDRRKLLHVSGETPTLMTKLSEWLEKRHG